MKNSKIFLSLALLISLGLGACNKGKGKSSATPTSSESSESEVSSSSSEEHHHTFGQYGFCSCGQYQGTQFALEDGMANIPNSFIGDMNVGDKRFFSISGLKELHGLHIEDWDGWSWEYETEIGADVHAYRRLNNQDMDEILIGFNTIKDVLTQEPIAFEEDKNVYFVVEAHKMVKGGFLDVIEDHIYSELSGTCLADGEFRSNGTYDGDTWEAIPVGSESKTGVSFSEDEKHHYFKIVEDPTHLLPFSHHKFNLNLTNIPSNCVKLYCLDKDFKPIELSLTESNETEVPENVHALYVNLTHKSEVSNASFSLKRVAHCNEKHGYCPDCDLITLPSSQVLTMNADFTSQFAVESGNTYTFAFDFGTTEEFAIQFNSPIWAHVASSVALYVYDDVKEDFVLVYRSGTSTAEIEYDLKEVYYGVTKGFFEFIATANYDDVQIRVHDYL